MAVNPAAVPSLDHPFVRRGGTTLPGAAERLSGTRVERPTGTVATRLSGAAAVVLLAVTLVLAGCAGGLAEGPASAGVAGAGGFDLVLMGTTDVHGRVYPHDYYTGRPTVEGLARLKPLVDSVRAVHPGRTFLFDSGDLLQGNPLGFVHARIHGDAPNPIIQAMNLLGYDAAALGNHEFNYGLDHLGRAVEQAEFPFLSGNIFHHGTTRHAYAPSALLPQLTPAGDTLWIGVTGNTPPGVHVWDRHNVEGVLEFRDIVASLGPVVADLRARGADIVVVLSHGGLEGTSYDTVTTGLPAENEVARLVAEVPGIDVVFMGHTHSELADSLLVTTANPEGVLLTQAAQWARSLAVATLRVERRTAGEWRVASRRGAIVRPRMELADREFMDSLRWAHERTVEYVNTRLGTTTEAWEGREARVRPTAIVGFVNEVMRRAAGADIAANAAFRIDARFPAGEVTVADVATLYPYDNTLKAIRITGAQLRAYLEKSAEYYNGWPAPAGGSVTNFSVPGYNFDIVTGVDYTIDLTRPVGQRITTLRYRGADVTPAQTFTMAINNYRQSGGGGYGMIADAPVVYDRGEDVRDLVIEEVRRLGTLRRADYEASNWRIVPAAAADAAAREQGARELSGATSGAVAAATAATTPERKRLRVLATNDFHGRLEPELPSWAGGRPVGGAAALASYFNHERAGFSGPTLLLDGGDVMQGTPISNLTDGRSTVDYFNYAGYTASALGNHEFDWGIGVMQERIAQADFHWLAANVFVAGSDTAPTWARPTALLEVDGVRVGILGLATEETPEKTKADNVRGFEFRSGSAAMDRYVPQLRAAGADFVIVVAHAGATCDAAMTACRGEAVDWARGATHLPDLFVAGHTHEVVRFVAHGMPIIETGAYGTRYGVVDLERVSADSVDVWIRGTPAAWADRVVPDSGAAALVERYRAEVAPLVNRRITVMAERLDRIGGDYELGRLIADAQRAALGTQLALMNNGGIRASTPAGEVAWGDLYNVQPFENRLVRLVIRGNRVLEALEHALASGAPRAHVSGVTVEYDASRPVGRRIIRALLENGTPIDPAATYSITVNDFLAQGEGDGFEAFADAIERVDSGIIDLDALVTYLQTLPAPVRAPTAPRFRPVGQANTGGE